MLLDSFVDQGINQARILVGDLLEHGSTNLPEILVSVFGDRFDLNRAINLLESWATGKTNISIEVLPAASINNAQGAFAQGTIYLAQELLMADNAEFVTRVLL